MRDTFTEHFHLMWLYTSIIYILEANIVFLLTYLKTLQLVCCIRAQYTVALRVKTQFTKNTFLVSKTGKFIFFSVVFVAVFSEMSLSFDPQGHRIKSKLILIYFIRSKIAEYWIQYRSTQRILCIYVHTWIYGYQWTLKSVWYQILKEFYSSTIHNSDFHLYQNNISKISQLLLKCEFEVLLKILLKTEICELHNELHCHESELQTETCLWIYEKRKRKTWW